jgi:hypothetical protein
MRHARTLLALVALLAVALVAAPAATQPAPKLPEIPGITAKDAFPRACVDCHVVLPEGDMRISTLLAAWRQSVDAKLMAKAKAAAPAGATLRGKHPLATESLSSIPDGCSVKCHKPGSKLAPPMAEMVHTIHLTGGAENHFLTRFQGQCTHCHKLDAKGDWKVPSGPEKK